jgi:hypothetical protein
MSSQNEDREPIERILSDPITKELLKKANLTKIQLETLLINFFVDETEGRSERYETKSRLRKIRSSKGPRTPSRRSGVTRGAYRRVLGQACTNVIRTIYTLALLAYVGVLESPSLEPYLQLNEMIKGYMVDIGFNDHGIVTPEEKHHIKALRKRIVDTLNKYTNPFILSGRKSMQ